MSLTLHAVYTKNDTVFATAQEAWANKNSLCSPELQQSIDSCFAQLLSDGLLLEPVSATWDQATSELTIVKVVSSSVEAYDAAITFDTTQLLAASSNAGWTLVRTFAN